MVDPLLGLWTDHGFTANPANMRNMPRLGNQDQLRKAVAANDTPRVQLILDSMVRKQLARFQKKLDAVKAE